MQFAGGCVKLVVQVPILGLLLKQLVFDGLLLLLHDVDHVARVNLHFLLLPVEAAFKQVHFLVFATESAFQVPDSFFQTPFRLAARTHLSLELIDF